MQGSPLKGSLAVHARQRSSESTFSLNKFFSMSNGWITTICFTNAPQRFAPFELELRETSEEMVFTGLTSGLITGSLMSFVVKAVTVYA